MAGRIWAPKKAAGLWCVGGIGDDSWRLGRNVSEEKIPVAERFQTLKDAGVIGYSGHVGSDYEFELDDENAPHYYKKVKAAGDALDMEVVDIVGAEFKTETVRRGSFTSADPEVRQYALDNARRAADLAMEWGVDTVRFWFGSDGKDGAFHLNGYDAEQRIREGLLLLHETHPGVIKSIEGKPGEPKGNQVLDTTATGIALCVVLNGMTGIKREGERFIDAKFVIGPELNHMYMNGEDVEANLAMAVAYGVMGDLHACDGPSRVARDFDQQLGKYNPITIFEGLAALAQGYKDGKYKSKWIILDQNTSAVPQGFDQMEHLRHSVDYIDAALKVANNTRKMNQFNQLREEGRFVELDRLVMRTVGRIMYDAARAHSVDMNREANYATAPITASR